MSNALEGPYIQAAGYTRGRNFVESASVWWLVAHSAQGAKDELDLGSFFSRTSKGSSNAGIGQDGGYCGYVNYGDTPWTNPPLNQESDTVELCGFAEWTRGEWLAYPAMLETFAAWIAWRSAVRGIPIVLLTVDDIRAGKPGIADHRTVNLVYHMSTHWDLGYNFPWDVVIPRARALAGIETPVLPPPLPPTPPPVVPDPTNPFGRPLLQEDGFFGPVSIEEAQRQTGTFADGVISTPSAWVNAVQTKLNALGYRDWQGLKLKVDGWGIYSNLDGDTPKTRTTYAFQRYLGTRADGVFSGPPGGSAAVKAIQHRLNLGQLW